ncbi:MAG: tetratricopeptide repeat protein [Candidatus Loosdrechtia sp.]|uniref:tetratricopeptide repeat protein n=1 Tax=Candidatus Loosdrechtia sp. TaxID=3101272 RepID=UPI003A777D8E|nr:MAG: tetratricopeptide repeat protein [Candidatus Jettenia sp. AMX2]
MKTFKIFSITILSISYLGCNGISARQVIQPDNTETAMVNMQEKAYAHFCTGYFFMLDGDWENAAENFEKALQFDNSSERIIRHLATCYFRLGNEEKAISFIEKLARMKPDEFSIHYSLATLYELAGRSDDAIVEYERARQCKITPFDSVFLTDILYRLANLYMQKGMTEEGVECYKSMLDTKLVSEPAKIYYEIGLRYFEINNMEKAVEYFLLAKQADPNLNHASLYLTFSYDGLGDYENAIREANKFLQKEPDSWIIHLTLSEIYEKIKDKTKRDENIEKTREILKRNINTGSINPREYYILSHIYRNQQELSKAIAVVENMKLIPLDKETYRDVHFLLANLYYENKDFDKVENELLMTLKYDPDFHEANNFLGYFFAENNKNLDKAIQLIHKALQAEPENGAYLDSLGWAYYKKAQMDGEDYYLTMALQKLSEAVQFTEEPDIYEHIGEVHYSLGNWDEAVKAYEKAEALYKRIPGQSEKADDITYKLDKIKRLISKEDASMRTVETGKMQK